MKSRLTFWTFFLLVPLLFSCGEDEKTAAQINVELQGIELDIYEKIANNKKEEALELLKKLNHPSDEEWKEKQKQSTFESLVNGGNKYYTYNEWWSERRDELRVLILGTEKPEDPTTGLQEIENLAQEGIDSTGKMTVIKNELLGTYIHRNDTGEIKFYKILNVKDEYTKIIYQDNTGGSVNIKSFIVEAFDQNYLADSFNPNSGIIIASNENNKSERIRLKLNLDSSNNKEIIDPSGLVFSIEQN